MRYTLVEVGFFLVLFCLHTDLCHLLNIYLNAVALRSHGQVPHPDERVLSSRQKLMDTITKTNKQTFYLSGDACEIKWLRQWLHSPALKKELCPGSKSNGRGRWFQRAEFPSLPRRCGSGRCRSPPPPCLSTVWQMSSSCWNNRGTRSPGRKTNTCLEVYLIKGWLIRTDEGKWENKWERGREHFVSVNDAWSQIESESVFKICDADKCAVIMMSVQLRGYQPRPGRKQTTDCLSVLHF